MKRLVLGIVFLMTVATLFSQDPIFGIPDRTISPPMSIYDPKQVRLKWDEFNGIVLRNVLYIFIEDTKGGIRIPIKITKGNLLVNGDGYYTFTYEGRRFILRRDSYA